MNNRRKIINDAVHGFITIPNNFLYELLQHRFVQRLNRIKQLGVSSMVYPSATHTRFQHSLGAMYLTSEAIKELQNKGHNITEEESDAVLAAILLHDIGHCPYSHVLEGSLIDGINHEKITDLLMGKISAEIGGRLDMAIDIFRNKYSKRFLHQLVSSQLDMDRLDYLMRDSFFTGVVEGSIGSARIIKMLDVFNDNLVIEQKGMLSVENYLISRRFMYWQVYYHKTSVAAETMLIGILKRAKELALRGEKLFAPPALLYFIENDINGSNFMTNEATINNFVDIDDSDIISSIKVWAKHHDKILSMLSKDFINRKLFKTTILPEDIDQEDIKQIALQKEQEIANYLGVSDRGNNYFSSYLIVKNDTYNYKDNKIMVLLSDGSTKEISQKSSILTPQSLNYDTKKNYLCYYKI